MSGLMKLVGLILLLAVACEPTSRGTAGTIEPTLASLFNTTVPQDRVLQPTPSPVIKVTHVIETIYYPVNGGTTEEILASVEANGPKTLHQGGDAFTTGLTEVEAELTYSLEGDSPCTILSANLAINFTVTLPRHANAEALSPQVLDRWRQFAAEVAFHEQTHVDISLATMKEFTEVAPISGAQLCDRLKSQLDKAFDRFMEIEDERQEGFHADELARSNAAQAPLQLQLADAETELARLDAMIDARSAQITTLATEITRIERSYRFSGIPAAIYDEYERTVNQHNALIKESNTLSNSYNAVVEKINHIIEELAWIP